MSGKTNQAYEYLKKAIIQNEISPGAPLNEMELAAKFCMSRSLFVKLYAHLKPRASSSFIRPEARLSQI